MDDARRILIRCDAAPEIGFGHVVRCLALADAMRDNHNWQVDFAMMIGEIGFSQVHAKGYAIYRAPRENLSGVEEGDWLCQVVTNSKPDVLLLDVRTYLTTSAVQSIRESGVLIVTIDDPSERRLVADLAFYPPVPQVEQMDWTGFAGERYVGWEWVLLRPEFAQAREKKLQELPRPKNSSPRILVTMGGSDPAGFTLTVLKALDTLQEDFSVCVVLGNGFLHDQELNDWLKTAQRTYTIKRNVTDMAEVMIEAEIAVISFGVTAYELATIGVPAIYYCLTDDHAISASAFVKEGIGLSLGSYCQIDVERACSSIEELIRNRPRRLKMRKCATMLIDGGGVRRISTVIMERIK